MIKYLWRGQKPVFIVLLIDLIILASVLLLVSTTGFQEYIITFQEEWNIQSANDFYYILNLLKNLVTQLQVPFILAVIFYLFSGARLSQMLKAIGKRKSVQLLAILLILSGTLSYGIHYLAMNSAYHYYGLVYLNISIWFAFVGLLTVYLLVFHSNLKYRNWLCKGALVAAIMFTAYILFILQYSTDFTSINSYNIPEIESYLAPASQLSLPIYNVYLAPLIKFVVILLSTTLSCGLVLKKVGK